MYHNYEIKWQSRGGSGTWRGRARSEYEAIDMCKQQLKAVYGDITILNVKES